MRAVLAGAFGALTISGVAVLAPQSGLLDSYLSGSDTLRLWALLGLSAHFLLYLATGIVWVGFFNRESVPTKAFQLGIAAPTALATLLNISPTAPTFKEFDSRIPTNIQDVCQFAPHNAFIFGLYALAIPKGVKDCSTIKEAVGKATGSAELASSSPDLKDGLAAPRNFTLHPFNSLQPMFRDEAKPSIGIDQATATASVDILSKLSQPTALAVSDALAEKLKSEPEEKHELVDALVSSIKPASESDATASNTNVVRTLALGGSGWAQNTGQTKLIDSLKTAPAYETDGNYRYWVDQALDAARTLPANGNLRNGNMPAIK